MKVSALLLSITCINGMAIDAFESAFNPWGKSDQHVTMDIKISDLVKTIQQSQVKKTTEYHPKYMFPPVTWTQNKGLFSSYIHLNFQGEKFQTTVRNKLSFPDGNYFL